MSVPTPEETKEAMKVLSAHMEKAHSLRKKLATGFIFESNKIEGIHHIPTEKEVEMFMRFMDAEEFTKQHLFAFVEANQPDAVLRNKPSIPGVQVGGHIAPASGVYIEQTLDWLLERANEGEDPWQIHVEYEILHPFTDCNGRSGRLLWAWQMGWKGLKLGFLHKFYYQTLSHQR